MLIMTGAVRRFAARHRLLCNMALYAGLYSSGDISRQTITMGEQRRLDWQSAARSACVGSLATSPFNFAWYTILDRLVKGRGAGVVVAKVACDQLIAGPVGIAIFFIGTSILERKDDIFEDLRRKGVRTYLVGCIYWPMMQAFNFSLVPTTLRTAYVGCAAFFWCNIISFFKTQRIQPPNKLLSTELQT